MNQLLSARHSSGHVEVGEHAVEIRGRGVRLRPRRGRRVGILQQVAGGETDDSLVALDDAVRLRAIGRAERRN